MGPPPSSVGRTVGGLADRLLRHSRPARPSAAPRGPAPAGERADAPAQAGVREAATREARRLRAAVDAPEYERRELLADLGTRLAAMTADLGGGPAEQAVRSLVAELAEEQLATVSGPALAALWDRALAVLDALAAGTDPGTAGTDPGTGGPDPGAGGPGPDGSGAGGSRAFWKRPDQSA